MQEKLLTGLLYYCVSFCRSFFYSEYQQYSKWLRFNCQSSLIMSPILVLKKTSTAPFPAQIRTGIRTRPFVRSRFTVDLDCRFKRTVLSNHIQFTVRRQFQEPNQLKTCYFFLILILQKLKEESVGGFFLVQVFLMWLYFYYLTKPKDRILLTPGKIRYLMGSQMSSEVLCCKIILWEQL